MSTDADLERRIRLGEDSSLEFKAVALAGTKVRGPSRRDFADELAAMANGRGGTIVLGVNDRTQRVEGVRLEDLGVVETWVREICNDLIKPALDADILKRELTVAEGDPVVVIRVDVQRSLVVHESPGGYFRRIGSSKRKMSPDVLARHFQERAYSRLIRFDETPVPGTSATDLQYALAGRFVRGEPDLDTMRKLRVVADNADGKACLTVAGALMCTPDPGRWLPHAHVQAVSYATERTDADYQTDARDIGGPLDEQVGEALHFVRRNMLVRATKTMARSETPQFSARAVFEALVNAVAHRDYSMLGARIRLHMFSDRLELYVPGSLTNTLTPDSLHLRQSSRNELAVSLLARCPAPSGVGRTRLMDRRGDGVPIIRDECTRLSGSLPEYSMVDDSELRLIMRAGHEG